jgi:hypothetical protein
MACLLVGSSIAALGCERGPSEEQNKGAAPPVAVVSPAPSHAIPPPAATVVAPVPSVVPLPPVPRAELRCEVEFRGKVVGLRDKEIAKLYIADDDCLAPSAHLLGTFSTRPDGTYFAEVFSKWGADLSICAAISPIEGKPATRYGKAAGKFHAEKTGEVEFNDVVIVLAVAPPKVFAKLNPATVNR